MGVVYVERPGTGRGRRRGRGGSGEDVDVAQRGGYEEQGHVVVDVLKLHLALAQNVSRLAAPFSSTR
jgi:hypothetical protein